jgi:hypothetical protein
MSVPTACPPAATTAVEAAPVKTRDDTPTQPLPATRRGKIARIAVKKMPAALAHHAPEPRTVEAPNDGEVRQGALLDPFGQDE